MYSGNESQFQLEELEAGGEYVVRVCCVRGGLAGAWSGSARLALPPAPPPPRAPRVRRPPRSLTPRHVALIMAALFLLLAVGVAVLLQRLVEAQP